MTQPGRRVRFLADFDYKPEQRVTIAYQAGSVQFVRLECAQRAVAAGKAEYVSLPAPPAGIAATIAKKKSRRKGTARGGQ